ncbi:hypothetical protein [Sphingobium indicum]|uniref:hypothetical protein n=1 Tax=Sphingobium indicum TaxID=332055 RepID=UPI0012DCA310|nr:hypothetical protein [Sphingobium indicum]
MRKLDVNSAVGRTFIERNFPGQLPVVVPRTHNLQNGQCYQNVRQIVAANGGQAVWGWYLQETPGSYIEAMHHAVWQNPSGILEDVTGTTTADESPGDIVFIPSNDIEPNQYDPLIPSIFHQIDTSPLTRFWIEGNILRVKLMARETALVRNLRHRIDAQGRVVLMGSPTAEIRAIATQIRELTSHLIACDAKMAEVE